MPPERVPKEEKNSGRAHPKRLLFTLRVNFMHHAIFIVSRRALTRSTIALLSLLFGCKTSYDKMDEVEKAKLLHQLRKQAEEQLGRFQKSEEDPSGVDIDALLKYVELHKQTTEIAPSSCPNCFALYGQALGRLARYYQTLVEAFENDLKTAPPEEKPSIEAKIKKYRQEVVETLQRSNRQFQVYFNNSGEIVNPYWYFWVVSQYEMLEDYRHAIFYLNLYAESFNLNEDQRKEVADLKKTYQEKQRRQEDADLRRELEDEGNPKAPRADAKRPQTAN